MIRVVYVHGLGGSGNGSSSKNVKKYFEKKCGKDFEFSAGTYDLLQPKESFSRIAEDTKNADLIIASSLGGFYSSALIVRKNPMTKVVLLNPCLDPKKYIPGLLWEEQKVLYNEEKCFTEWDEIITYWDAENLTAHNTYAGIFATEDEFFHCQDIFRKNFNSTNGKNLVEISGCHEIAKHSELLEEALDFAKKIFDEV